MQYTRKEKLMSDQPYACSPICMCRDVLIPAFVLVRSGYMHENAKMSCVMHGGPYTPSSYLQRECVSGSGSISENRYLIFPCTLPVTFWCDFLAILLSYP